MSPDHWPLHASDHPSEGRLLARVCFGLPPGVSRDLPLSQLPLFHFSTALSGNFKIGPPLSATLASLCYRGFHTIAKRFVRVSYRLVVKLYTATARQSKAKSIYTSKCHVITGWEWKWMNWGVGLSGGSRGPWSWRGLVPALALLPRSETCPPPSSSAPTHRPHCPGVYPARPCRGRESSGATQVPQTSAPTVKRPGYGSARSDGGRE